VRLPLMISSALLLAATTASAQAPRPTTNRPAEELYKQNCVMCHMPDGNAAIKQMNFANGEWIHGNTPAKLAKVITDGVPATAMMSFKERFSDQEILALAKYVLAFDKHHKAAPGPPSKKTAPKTGTP